MLPRVHVVQGGEDSIQRISHSTSEGIRSVDLCRQMVTEGRLVLRDAATHPSVVQVQLGMW